MSYTLSQRNQLSEEWKSHLVEQESSGLSIPAYCQGKGIAIWKFRYWKQKIRRSCGMVKPSNFISIRPRPSMPQLGTRLILSPSMVLETSGLPDPAWLSELLERRSKGGLSC